MLSLEVIEEDAAEVRPLATLMTKRESRQKHGSGFKLRWEKSHTSYRRIASESYGRDH